MEVTMEMIRKKLPLLLALLLLLTSIVGCTGTPGDSSASDVGSSAASPATDEPSQAADGEKKTLTIWRGQGTDGEEALYNSEISGFNAQSADTVIEYEVFPYDDFGQTVRAAAATDSLPELVYLDGTEVANHAFIQSIIPITSYIDDEFKAKYADSAFSYYKDELYGVNQQDGGLALWANRAHLEAAEVRIPSYEEPWTADEFVTVLEALKEVEEVRYPLDMATSGGGYVIYAWQPWIVSFGGDWYNHDTLTATGALDSEETVGAISYIMDLAAKGLWNPDETSGSEFIDRRSSLVLTGHWTYVEYSENLGDDLMLVPMPDLGNGSQTAVGGLSFCVTPVAEQNGVVQNAVDFIQFALGDEFQSQVNDANGSLPVNKEILASLDVFKDGATLSLYAKQLSGGRFAVRPPSPAFPTYQEQVGTAVMNIISGGDIKSELESAAQRIDEVIEANQYNA